MVWIEERSGSNNYLACWKQNGKNVSRKSFHSIRHALVSAARSNSSLSADLVRAVVGHESEEVEQQYFTPDISEKGRMLEAMEEYISPAVSLSPYSRFA